jgi:hypothetical protein
MAVIDAEGLVATRELFGNPNSFVSNSFPGEHPIFMPLG